jgi:hypothetical protein
MQYEIIPTERKALKINLDTDLYGSFAEIGGGQEVARHFFLAGGASGTVAKTISAYDKSFSDYNYNDNKPGRYVSEDRLQKMLNHEYSQTVKLLRDKHPRTRFFAFADTVEVLNYAKTNYSHGWMGIKFQHSTGGKPNTVVIHVKLLENEAKLQQATLGVLGVNLLYACVYYPHEPLTFLKSLTDNLSLDRFRITMINMSGPDLDYVDNRLLAVQLVKLGISRAMMFDKNGNVRQPSDMLYKKNVLALRGSFRPVTYVTKDILRSSIELFQKDEDYREDNTLSFCELSLNNLLSEGQLDERDFLERVDMLNLIGQNVMVSDIREYYRLVEFFGQFKLKKLRIVIGVPTLEKVFHKKYYNHLKGGILEAVGKMFPLNTKLYIYPAVHENGTVVTAKSLKIDDDLKSLYQYLQENKFILDLQSNIPVQLHITSGKVLQMIKSGDEMWEKYVPMVIAAIIKEKKLFSK